MKGEGGVCRWFMFSSIWPFDYAKRKRRKYVKLYWFSNLNLCFENCNHPILTSIDFISILCNVIEVNFDKRILFKDIIFPPGPFINTLGYYKHLLMNGTEQLSLRFKMPRCQWSMFIELAEHAVVFKSLKLHRIS